MILFDHLFGTCIVLYLLRPLLFVLQDLTCYQFYILNSDRHSKYQYFPFGQEFSLDQLVHPTYNEAADRPIQL